MSIPTFTSFGPLPPGIHDATLAEINAVFGATNSRREDLFGKLDQFVQASKRFQLFTALYVDGSFVTDKPSPGDIDAVLELPRAALPRLLAHPDRLTLIDTAAVKAAYEVHLFFQPEAPPTPDPDMAKFFQHLRPEEALVRRLPADTTRGILRVAL